MYEQTPRFRRRGRQPPPQQPPFHLPNNQYHRQAPSNFPNLNFDLRNQISNSTIDKIDEAVTIARRNLIEAGENVSTWKVSNAVLSLFEVDSWRSLKVRMEHVPSLYRIKLIEEKVK